MHFKVDWRALICLTGLVLFFRGLPMKKPCRAAILVCAGLVPASAPAATYTIAANGPLIEISGTVTTSVDHGTFVGASAFDDVMTEIALTVTDPIGGTSVVFDRVVDRSGPAGSALTFSLTTSSLSISSTATGGSDARWLANNNTSAVGDTSTLLLYPDHATSQHDGSFFEDYDLIFGALVFTNLAVIPTPASLPLLATAIGAFGFARRRRQSVLNQTD